ncbi:MAG: hydrogenase expression protein HypE [Alphaproteobacteria bacterium]|nr:MAG: hydrogenase expression protein HypE [Alphaproteobacteria bacterium]
MTALECFLAPYPVASVPPVLARHLDDDGWQALRSALAVEAWDLTGLWHDGGDVLATLVDPGDGTLALVRHRPNPASGGWGSLGGLRPGAIRLERTVVDRGGPRPADATDRRPWLDHQAQPTLGYPFLPVEGEGLHQVPVGPVHAGIIEPGHFRFHAQGEAVVRLEARLGYVRKGTLEAMVGRAPGDAAVLAGRLSGDTTVAHSIAFARAVEAALGIAVPARAHWLRAVMLEVERLANHFGDCGAIANDAAFALLHMECGRARERIARTAAPLFGHRLMMDRVVPGGVAVDPDDRDIAALSALLPVLAEHLAAYRRTYRGLPSLLDRTLTTGRIAPALARCYAAGGVVGRASGQAIIPGQDARTRPGVPPYDMLPVVPVGRDAGDVDARVQVRLDEIEASLALIAAMIEHMPRGEVRVVLPDTSGEGLGWAEGFRGDCQWWVRLEHGKVAAVFGRDPSWFHWPLLEAAIDGNIIADFPLINKSINGSYSGVDL